MNPAENWQTAAGPIAAEPEPAPAFAAPTALPIAPPTVSRKNPFLARCSPPSPAWATSITASTCED